VECLSYRGGLQKNQYHNYMTKYQPLRDTEPVDPAWKDVAPLAQSKAGMVCVWTTHKP